MFKQESEYSEILRPGMNGKTGWSSPSNIALVKYWGKRDNQIPENASISMTLREALTNTFIEWEVTAKEFSYEFLFEGSLKPDFQPKLEKFFKEAVPLLPFLNKMHLSIQSSNTFPHSTGIASSASAMSALALSLVDIENQLTENQLDMPDFLQKSSFLARIGSGSAARSVYPYFATWGKAGNVPGSSDLYATQVILEAGSFFTGLQDAILIVSSERKEVSSSAGHDLMKTNPYASSRYDQAAKNHELLIKAIQNEQQKEFILIVENEALTLHGLMMGSQPGFILVKHGTIEIIKKIRQFRDQTGLFITFTLDAGPNVHLLYHEDDEYEIQEFVESELVRFTEKGKIIWDGIGSGPEKIG